MHNKKEETCYLCKRLNDDYSQKTTQEHHVVFGRGNRKLSEKYGLKVYLCMNHHLHDGGPDAVHRNIDICRMLEQEAQKAFEQAYPDRSFRQIFGKSYLEEYQWQQVSEEKDTGIQFIDGPVYDLDW